MCSSDLIFYDISKFVNRNSFEKSIVLQIYQNVFNPSSNCCDKISEESKSFLIGKDNNVRVRFVIYIEPK